MNKSECKRPESLKVDPQECSPEQIRECHGKEGKHTCVEKEEKEEN